MEFLSGKLWNETAMMGCGKCTEDKRGGKQPTFWKAV